MAIPNKKIAHLTSVHKRHDIRIFLKQCISLSKNNYDVTLIVADGKGNETNCNVKILDVGTSRMRLDRMLRTTSRILTKAIEIDADIYHMHDPELIPIGLKLKKLGKKVIFDAHEDFPDQLESKSYLNPYFAKALSFTMKYYERYACSKLDAIVSATPHINDKFERFSKKAVNINNYPILDELQPIDKDWSRINNEVAYIGTMAKIRGIKQVIDALPLTQTKTRLNLAGDLSEPNLRELFQSSEGWSLVNDLGLVSREEVKNILQRSTAGIVTFLPDPNHIAAQPNKMFEYMSAGIPVIASNFPLWKNLIENNECGICVNPGNPEEIAKAIDLLVNDKALAERMGNNGIKAIAEKYNWPLEEKKLLKLYKDLLGS